MAMAGMMYAQHRPPSAPRTPDNEAPLWAQSQPSGPGGQAHYSQAQYGMHPSNGGGGGYERSRFGPSPSNYAPSSSSAGAGQGGAGQDGPHLGGLGGPTSRSPMPGGGPTPAPSLLGHNLAAHLNNPPSLPTQGGGPSPYPPAPGQGQHSLLVPSTVSPAPGMPGPGSMSGMGAGMGQGVSGAVGLASAGMGGPAAPGGGKLLLMPNGTAPPTGSEEEKIYVLISQLLKPETRETALVELSKKREMYDDLALVLWGGFGVMACLMLEIVSVYPALSPATLSAHASNRVCNALALLQCVASHAETRPLFLNAHFPLFLYPFLNTTSKTRPFEYLRLTSLGVVGALVKQNDNSDVVNFLLSTEIIPLCLRIMETGSELSKTVAIFIVQKILLDDLGLQYICQTYDRFYAVGAVLANMVAMLQETQATRLLKHVVRCYLRLCDNPRAREALKQCLPDALKDGTFTPVLKGDPMTRRCMQSLLDKMDGAE